MIRDTELLKQELGITDKSTKYNGDHSGYDLILKYEVLQAIDNYDEPDYQTGEPKEQGRYIVVELYGGEYIYSLCYYNVRAKKFVYYDEENERTVYINLNHAVAWFMVPVYEESSVTDKELK